MLKFLNYRLNVFVCSALLRIKHVYTHTVYERLQGQVGSEAAADFGHRCLELWTQEGAVQHETGDAGTQQGELLSMWGG